MKVDLSYKKVVIVVALMLLCSGLLIYRYARIGPVPRRISESTKQRVRENYAKYSQLSFVPIDDTVDFRGKMKLAVSAALSTELTEEQKNQLGDFLVEILVSKKTGDFNRYKRSVGLDAQMIENSSIKYFYEHWVHRKVPVGIGAEELAQEMFLFESGYGNGGHRFSDCSFEPNGIRTAYAYRKTTESPDTLAELTDDELHYWLGPVANGLPPFFVPEVSLDEILATEGAIHWIDFQVIVKTKDKDAYPLRIRTWYHPKLKRWVIISVTRHSSLRAAYGSPPLIF